MVELLPLLALIFVAALLYSSVGHAGASGYLAVMALMNMPPATMKPAALLLNILVAIIGTQRFASAGHFSWPLFLPFALASTPMAYVGGYLQGPPQVYRNVLGVVLIYAAFRMFTSLVPKTHVEIRPPSLWLAALCGAGMGLLSGFVGVGGGIFLSPLLILMHWADPRTTAGVSVAFILLNSVAGFAGSLSANITQLQALRGTLAALVITAGVGGLIGSHIGSRHMTPLILRRLLAIVLIVAGIKLLTV